MGEPGPNIKEGQRLLQEAQSTFQTLEAKRDLAEVNEILEC